MSNQRYSSYREFWPYYVSEHLRPMTRRLHFIGTGLLVPIVYLAVTVSPWWLLVMPVAGYGFAWSAHFFVENNRPATFTYPLWSLVGDFHMFGLMLLGRMDEEVHRIAGQRAENATEQGST
jgi:hypothetical protein